MFMLNIDLNFMTYNRGMIDYDRLLVIVLILFFLDFHFIVGYFTLFIQFLFYLYISCYLFSRTLGHKE